MTTVATKRILLIEDHPDIAEVINFNLSRQSYDLVVAKDGREGLELAKKSSPDLILLDLMLPVMDGLEVCRELRKNNSTKDTPIIMLTAKGEEKDIISGLEAGADDYVTKPFSPKELVARVKAVLRRGNSEITSDSSKLSFENLTIDTERHEVLLDNRALVLTLAEFRLLQGLVAIPGRVFTRDQLIDRMSGGQVAIVDRNIDVHISSLRKKLGDFGKKIVTIRGVGYRFGS